MRSWLICHNNNEEIKERTRSGLELYMTRGRNTTTEERIKIVSFCIANGKNYGATIEKYKVSYQQIYDWVKKYETSGVTELVDKRGRRKEFEELTQTEKLKLENKVLRAELKQKEMAIAFSKKSERGKGADAKRCWTGKGIYDHKIFE